MARIYIYTMIALGIVLLTEALGIDTPIDVVTNLFGVVTSPEGFSSSDFIAAILDINVGVLIATIGVGLIVGLVARGQIENFIVLGFITGTLAVLAGTFVGLIIFIRSFDAYISVPIYIVLGMFTVGYIESLVEFFRGNI